MWYVYYFSSLVGMVVSGGVFLIVLNNAVHGLGMNWLALAVSIVGLVVSALVNALLTNR